TAISPWNFPLAIFTGQIAAALMAGNAVLAKPAEQTPLIATRAVELLHQAGVPRSTLQLLPGAGATVGTALTTDPRIKGIVFTGSTATAQTIARNAAQHLDPGTPLVAETGGLNAMIVDSTALPEQAVADIIASAFQSAGQRCSALRCLYVQDDSADTIVEMIKGAMDALVVGDPAERSTDVGPLIDAAAKARITEYLAQHQARILHQIKAPETGHFIPTTLLDVNGIEDIRQEIFGPVLHIARFQGDNVAGVVDAINAAGYGLTFGLHTRIDTRVQDVTDALHIGNMYVNRNQIGAVVGSQPFGGEGLSGTGPKAGGPHYLPHFHTHARPVTEVTDWTEPADVAALQVALTAATPSNSTEHVLPGPTGELNRLSTDSRPPLLCCGPGDAAITAQVQAVRDVGGTPLAVHGTLSPQDLASLTGFSGVLWWGDLDTARAYAGTLANRDGPILPLITSLPSAAQVLHERHLCVDTTASGGNAALLAG
ncbi:MAG: L-glutamate gamma-semialdehyde dehydrogenase, partial [Pseudomonadota bacterium]